MPYAKKQIQYHRAFKKISIWPWKCFCRRRSTIRPVGFLSKGPCCQSHINNICLKWPKINNKASSEIKLSSCPMSPVVLGNFSISFYWAISMEVLMPVIRFVFENELYCRHGLWATGCVCICWYWCWCLKQTITLLIQHYPTYTSVHSLEIFASTYRIWQCVALNKLLRSFHWLKSFIGILFIRLVYGKYEPCTQTKYTKPKARNEIQRKERKKLCAREREGETIYATSLAYYLDISWVWSSVYCWCVVEQTCCWCS